MTESFLDIFSTVIPVSALYVAVIALLVLYRNYIRSERREKINKSLHFIERWNDGNYQKALSLYISNFNEDDPYIDSELERILNFYEELAISVDHNIVDSDLLIRFFFYQIVFSYEHLSVAITKIRSERQASFLFRNYERLYGRLVSGASVRDRKARSRRGGANDIR